MRDIVGIDKTYPNAIYQNLYKQHKMFLHRLKLARILRLLTRITHPEISDDPVEIDM